MLSDLVSPKQEDCQNGQVFPSQLAYILKSVNIAKQEQSSNHVDFMFCINSSNQCNVSTLEHTLRLLEQNSNHQSKFHLANTKSKILMNESHTQGGNKSSLVAVRTLLGGLQMESKRLMNWVIETKVQDNQLRIKKLALLHD